MYNAENYYFQWRKIEIMKPVLYQCNILTNDIVSTRASLDDVTGYKQTDKVIFAAKIDLTKHYIFLSWQKNLVLMHSSYNRQIVFCMFYMHQQLY